MREKEVEKKMIEAVKKHGGLAPKWVAPGFAGVPDRLVFLPHGKFAMAEIKAPGEKPRELQLSRHRLFRRLGFKVYVIDSEEKINEMIKEVMQDGVHTT